MRERIELNPKTDLSRAFLAVALGHLGEAEEAQRVWRELEEINPNYSFEGHMAGCRSAIRPTPLECARGLPKPALKSEGLMDDRNVDARRILLSDVRLRRREAGALRQVGTAKSARGAAEPFGPRQRHQREVAAAPVGAEIGLAQGRRRG